MDFVNEHDGASAILLRPLGISHHLLDLFNADEHGGKLNELRFCHAGNNLRQRGFAGAWRAPENQGTDVVALNLRPQGFAGRDQIFLSYKLIERSRTHAVGERAGAVAWIFAVRSWLE